MREMMSIGKVNGGRRRLLAALLLSSLWLWAPSVSAWEKIDEAEGIQVYRKEVPNSALVAFRGTTVINDSAERILRVLGDNAHRTNWVDRLEKSVVLEQKSFYDYVIYQHFGLPVPLSDRDYVYRGQAKRSKKTGTVTLHLRSVTHRKAPKTEGVRAQLVNSFYRLTPISKTKTKVEVEILTDPKGWLPSWLVNLIQKSWPRKTLVALRNEVKKPWVTPVGLPPPS